MTKLNTPPLSTILRGLLAASLLCSLATLTQAAPKKNKKSKKAGLAQLEKEVYTVVRKTKGSRDGGISQTKLKVHALYSTATMDAFIDTSGDLYVQPKVSSKGDKVCGTILVGPQNRYSDPENKNARSKIRKVLGVTSSIAPARNPKEVTLNFELDKGVKSTVVYSFNGKEIKTEVATVDPRGIDSPTRVLLEAKIPPSHDLPIDASMGKKKSATKDCLVNMKGKKYTYAEPSKGTGKKRVASGEITGHWPGCKVVFGGKPGIGLSVYGGSLLLEGYDVVSGDPDKPAAKKSLSVSVVQGK